MSGTFSIISDINALVSSIIPQIPEYTGDPHTQTSKRNSNVLLIDLPQSNDVPGQGDFLFGAANMTNVDEPEHEVRKISLDGEYIKKNLGVPLTLALAEIVNRRPSDPIHYLGHWLLKWRWNQDQKQKHIDLVNALSADQERIVAEAIVKKKKQEEKRKKEEDLLRAEAEDIIGTEMEKMFQELDLPDRSIEPEVTDDNETILDVEDRELKESEDKELEDRKDTDSHHSNENELTDEFEEYRPQRSRSEIDYEADDE